MIANLTHWDLDGIVCHLLLKRLSPNIRSYGCGYGKLEKNVNRIILDKNIFFLDVVFVTDLAISIELSKLLHENFKTTFLFDHHETTSLIQNDLNPLYSNTYIDTSKCGASIVFDILHKKIKGTISEKTFQKIERLVELTNTYDLWKVDSKDFSEAYYLNSMFWMYGWSAFLERFFDGYEGLTKNELDFATTDLKKRIELFKKSEKMVFGDNKCLLVMSNDANQFINEVTLIEKGFNYYFLFIPADNKMSIRLRNSNSNLATTFDKIKENKIVRDCGAHPYAGGITLAKNYTQEEFEELVNQIYFNLEEQNEKNQKEG